MVISDPGEPERITACLGRGKDSFGQPNQTVLQSALKHSVHIFNRAGRFEAESPPVRSIAFACYFGKFDMTGRVISSPCGRAAISEILELARLVDGDCRLLGDGQRRRIRLDPQFQRLPTIIPNHCNKVLDLDPRSFRIPALDPDFRLIEIPEINVRSLLDPCRLGKTGPPAFQFGVAARPPEPQFCSYMHGVKALVELQTKSH
ncbi:MAG: hypothetical protein ACLGHC_00055 [Alphaproteobacteria bacterium]